MGRRSKKARGISDLRHLLLFFFGVLITVQAILFFVAFGHRSSQADLNKDERVLLSARELAHSARVKANELHLLAQDAAASGDPRDIRDYETRARPQSSDADYPGNSAVQKTQSALRQLATRAAAFEGNELSKLDTALASADAQRAAENKAINALKGFFPDRRGEFTVEAPADPKLATEILSGTDYEKTVRAVQADFSAFLSALDVRLFAVHKESARGFQVNFLLVLAGALLAFTPVAGILLYRATNVTVRSLKVNARKLTDELGRVNTELRTAVASREEFRRRLDRILAEQEQARNPQPPAEAVPQPPTLAVPRPEPEKQDEPQPRIEDLLTRLP